MSKDQAQETPPWRAWLSYLVPPGLFLSISGLADWWPAGRTLLYALKVVIVAGVLLYYFRRGAYPELTGSLFGGRPAASVGPVAVAAAVGVVVIAAWVGLDPYYPQGIAECKQVLSGGPHWFDHVAKLQGAFNPYAGGQLIPPGMAIVFRLVGAVLLVPIFEELLVRSWLLRLLIAERFRSVPIGAFSRLSFIVTTILFGLWHHEWLAGLMCGAAFTLLLYWKKDLWLCIISHAVANLALGGWVLWQGAWQFW